MKQILAQKILNGKIKTILYYQRAILAQKVYFSKEVLLKDLLFSIQRYSIHDGSGIRTIIFLKGCPLRCLCCCNPESQSTSQEIIFNPIKCIGCGRCLEVCPTGAAE